MQKLQDAVQIGHKTTPNRLLMPPLVCFNWADPNGYETVSRAWHYGLRAEAGTGTIVVEAAAISPDSRIIDTELGIWEDGHIDQYKRIADACHKHDSLVFVQLVHAGMKSFGDVVYSSSVNEVKNKTCHAMTLDQIDQVKADFVAAAVRAEKAGLDGVEIHGAHGYLLSQFTSSVTNHRTDQYGGSIENRHRLTLEIVEAVKEAVGRDFLITYRFGVNDPTFAEDIDLAKKLEAAGVTLLNVSSGIGSESLEAPEDFDFHKITYMGKVIRDHVTIPVASVYGLKKPEDAMQLVEKDHTDLVAIGRGLLADPQWSQKALAGQAVDVCARCKPWCKFAKDGFSCPWYVKRGVTEAI